MSIQISHYIGCEWPLYGAKSNLTLATNRVAQNLFDPSLIQLESPKQAVISYIYKKFSSSSH